jgi:glycosyltransferase involved in cell wall biosynthesis
MPDIVHLTTVHPRADVRILAKEARTLASGLGREVVLVVADGLGSSGARDGGIAVYDVGKPPAGRLGRFVDGSRRALREIRRLEPRIVHFHDPELLPAALILKACGYGVIYDIHEDVPRQILSKHWISPALRLPASWIVSALEWLAARSFDGLIAATPKIARRFPAQRTQVVQNFPILDELVVQGAAPYAKRAPMFAYVGGITAIRGAREMIEALEVLGPVANVRLDIAGTFSPPGLHDELSARPGWSRVTWHGHVGRAEVARLLSEARAGLVLLHPVENYVESYPVKMFEYMAAGLPVIASDFPLWREIIEETRCGLVVDPRSHDAIAAAMRWMLDHPREAEAMGRRGREAVERAYSWNAEGARLIDLYRRVCSRYL